MMNRERFAELAALVVAGEATPAEDRELHAALQSTPELRTAWAEIKAVDGTLREAAHAPAALPEAVRAQLHAARRAALAAPAAVAGENITPFPMPAPAPRRRLPSWLALAALFVALGAMAAFWWRPASPQNLAASAILGPRGEIASTQPTIAWQSTPGQQYDVWILPPEGDYLTAKPLFKADGVTPPLEFAALKPGPALAEQHHPADRLVPGTDYRLLVCLAGTKRLGGTPVAFHTMPAAK